ncbi:hypothetical protein SDJN02_20761, partial [Cucurbita argyrosperma subsp. argyrosperma]
MGIGSSKLFAQELCHSNHKTGVFNLGMNRSISTGKLGYLGCDFQSSQDIKQDKLKEAHSHMTFAVETHGRTLQRVHASEELTYTLSLRSLQTNDFPKTAIVEVSTERKNAPRNTLYDL